MTKETASVKDAVRVIVEELPDGASWDDVHYALYVRQKIETGRQAVAEGAPWRKRRSWRG